METQTDNIFTLRFFGNDVNPNSFSLKELGVLLCSIEDGVKSIVEYNYPSEDTENVLLSLSTIKNESNSLGIHTVNDITNTAIFDFAKSIKTDTYTNLPKKAYDSYKEIYQIVQKKNCQAELIYKGDVLYAVSPENKIIKTENVLIDIDATIYGTLIKLGSSSSESAKSRVWVELLESKTISFQVTKEQAEELGVNIYKLIALKGKIKWNVLTKTTVGFKFFEQLNFKRGNASKGFEQLRNLTTGFWDTLKTDNEIQNYLKGD